MRAGDLIGWNSAISEDALDRAGLDLPVRTRQKTKSGRPKGSRFFYFAPDTLSPVDGVPAKLVLKTREGTTRARLSIHCGVAGRRRGEVAARARTRGLGISPGQQLVTNLFDPSFASLDIAESVESQFEQAVAAIDCAAEMVGWWETTVIDLSGPTGDGRLNA
jgi:hypothetical protein